MQMMLFTVGHAFIISMDSLLEHQQSPTTSTSEDDSKWSKLCHTPYFRSTIVPNTSPPVIIGGQDRQKRQSTTSPHMMTVVTVGRQ